MLATFSPIFVADTKIMCYYSFVAPLKALKKQNYNHRKTIREKDSWHQIF